MNILIGVLALMRSWMVLVAELADLRPFEIQAWRNHAGTLTERQIFENGNLWTVH